MLQAALDDGIGPAETLANVFARTLAILTLSPRQPEGWIGKTVEYASFSIGLVLILAVLSGTIGGIGRPPRDASE